MKFISISNMCFDCAQYTAAYFTAPLQPEYTYQHICVLCWSEIWIRGEKQHLGLPAASLKTGTQDHQNCILIRPRSWSRWEQLVYFTILIRKTEMCRMSIVPYFLSRNWSMEKAKLTRLGTLQPPSPQKKKILWGNLQLNSLSLTSQKLTSISLPDPKNDCPSNSEIVLTATALCPVFTSILHPIFILNPKHH